MAYNEIIQELRKNKNLTQTDLAKIFCTTQRTISNWETGRNEPPYEMLIKYAQFFNVTTDYILGLTREENTQEKIAKNVNINYGNIEKITMKWGKIMSSEQFGNIINEGLFSGLYKAFELLFLTPPTCYIVYGMIVFTVALKILEKIIKKNRK